MLRIYESEPDYYNMQTTPKTASNPIMQPALVPPHKLALDPLLVKGVTAPSVAFAKFLSELPLPLDLPLPASPPIPLLM
jgi:hypothetical protein